MTLMIQTSRYHRQQRLLISLLCGLFAFWFAYDGWVSWPHQNDQAIERLMENPRVSRELRQSPWPGWNKASGEQRKAWHQAALLCNVEAWHTASDLLTQKLLALGLMAATLGSLPGLLCRTRVILQDQGLHIERTGPFGSRQEPIPWERVQRCDPSRWKDRGRALIFYHTLQGRPRQLLLQEDHFDGVEGFLTALTRHLQEPRGQTP